MGVAPLRWDVQIDQHNAQGERGAAFQIRVAAILRVYLSKESGISLRTISRLVVLVYLSAGLAGDRHDEAIICNGGRRLEIRNVEQRLRRAGVDRLFDYYEE